MNNLTGKHFLFLETVTLTQLTPNAIQIYYPWTLLICKVSLSYLNPTWSCWHESIFLCLVTVNLTLTHWSKMQSRLSCPWKLHICKVSSGNLNLKWIILIGKHFSIFRNSDLDVDATPNCNPILPLHVRYLYAKLHCFILSYWQETIFLCLVKVTMTLTHWPQIQSQPFSPCKLSICDDLS